MVRLIGVVLTIALCRGALAESPPKPLFASDDTFSITLAAPLRSIANDSSDDPDYRPAVLSYADATGAERELPIRLRARGKSRRNPDACDFPPLRLDLPKSATAGTVFAGQNKLKLVTQCQRRDPWRIFEQNLLKEYGLYRALNQLTPLSFRVRLVEVSYVDRDRGDAKWSSFGFFIEDKNDVAKRNQLEVADVVEVALDRLEPVQTNRIELFEFMIGNTDFSLRLGPPGESCCHNAVVMLGTDGLYRPVPCPHPRCTSRMSGSGVTVGAVSRTMSFGKRSRNSARRARTCMRPRCPRQTCNLARCRLSAVISTASIRSSTIRSNSSARF
jgi:hypothetical protein